MHVFYIYHGYKNKYTPGTYLDKSPSDCAVCTASRIVKCAAEFRQFTSTVSWAHGVSKFTSNVGEWRTNQFSDAHKSRYSYSQMPLMQND